MERLDDLGRAGFKIIQRPGEATFSMDAVLLAHFMRGGAGDALCDLGTGTGVIPLLMVAKGKAGSAVGVEIRADLAELADRNVSLNKVEGVIRVVRADLRSVTLSDLGRREPFDVVTANPPFHRPGTGRVSPIESRAVARHELECTLEDVAQAARRLIRSGGLVGLVHLTERLVDVLAALRAEGLEPKRMRVVRDKPGGRAKLVLVEARAGGHGGLVVEPDLVVRDEGGDYSAEMKAIYDHEP
ncbi:MAG: tRNA1(Val) (adenine(37)-N6)-methyltransferase [Bacillota bacterium]